MYTLQANKMKRFFRNLFAFFNIFNFTFEIRDYRPLIELIPHTHFFNEICENTA